MLSKYLEAENGGGTIISLIGSSAVFLDRIWSTVETRSSTVAVFGWAAIFAGATQNFDHIRSYDHISLKSRSLIYFDPLPAYLSHSTPHGVTRRISAVPHVALFVPQ